MSLLVKASREGQTIARVTPETALWKHVGFAAYRLETGDIVHVNEAQREVCIVVLSGTVSIEAGEHKWEKLGSRDSVFEDTAPYAVYLPPRLAATIRADRDAQVGVASAPATGKYPPRLIEPSQMTRSTRGKGANTRYVCDILPQTEPAEGLLVVEVRTPGGHASSYPPHKHDRDNVPVESSLEETYYHRLNPPQG
jgi:5-deoxy-glucuronate isomerase